MVFDFQRNFSPEKTNCLLTFVAVNSEIMFTINIVGLNSKSYQKFVIILFFSYKIKLHV